LAGKIYINKISARMSGSVVVVHHDHAGEMDNSIDVDLNIENLERRKQMLNANEENVKSVDDLDIIMTA
jgi:hypothetical protein